MNCARLWKFGTEVISADIILLWILVRLASQEVWAASNVARRDAYVFLATTTSQQIRSLLSFTWRIMEERSPKPTPSCAACLLMKSSTCRLFGATAIHAYMPFPFMAVVFHSFDHNGCSKLNFWHFDGNVDAVGVPGVGDGAMPCCTCVSVMVLVLLKALKNNGPAKRIHYVRHVFLVCQILN